MTGEPPLGGGERARLFVAVWPPSEVLDLLEALPREDGPGVRWLPRPTWHVTLRFFGFTDLGEAEAAFSAIQAVRTEAVLGPHPGRLGRGVLAVPVAGLSDLAASVGAATAHVGRPPDPRPFHGHLSLARLSGRPACGLTAARVSARWPVTEVALVRSETAATGARYATVATLALS